MFDTTKTPAMKRQLTKILTGLQRNPAVVTAVIVSDDGLAIAANHKKMHVISAATGDIFTTIRQANQMIGFADLDNVTIHLSDNKMMVCQPFKVRNIEIILTVIFNQEIAYKRLFTQTIQAIKQAVE